MDEKHMWLAHITFERKFTNEYGCVCNEIIFTAKSGGILCPPGFKRDIIVNDDDVFWRYLVKFHGGGDRFAAVVHKSGWLHDKTALVLCVLKFRLKKFCFPLNFDRKTAPQNHTKLERSDAPPNGSTIIKMSVAQNTRGFLREL